MTAQDKYAEGMQTTSNDKNSPEKPEDYFPKMTYLCDFLKEDEIKIFSCGTCVLNEAHANKQVSNLIHHTDSPVCTNAETNSIDSNHPMKIIPNSTIYSCK